MLSETTQAAITIRAEKLAEGMCRALIQATLNALNEWALEPSEKNRKAVTRIMRRYECEVQGEGFQTPTKHPFGTRSQSSRFNLPDDLGQLLQEARDILPQLLEVERLTAERKKAEAREVQRAKKAKKAEKGAAQGMPEQEVKIVKNSWENVPENSGKLPWE